jgi:hypothetical protein
VNGPGTARTITVPGVGRAEVAPDTADVRLGVAVTRPTVAEARAAAAATAAAILESALAAGVARGDVRTSGLTVSPEYDYDDRRPRLRGQQVSHQYRVTVRALDALGAVIDGALAAGATTLDGVAFRTADPAAAEATARAAAIRDARSKATAIAAEAGVTLGGIVEVVEGGPGVPGPRPMVGRMAMVAEASPTPVEAGTEEIAVWVTATFEIAPAG